jgi:hypothetical protein
MYEGLMDRARTKTVGSHHNPVLIFEGKDTCPCHDRLPLQNVSRLGLGKGPRKLTVSSGRCPQRHHLIHYPGEREAGTCCTRRKHRSSERAIKKTSGPPAQKMWGILTGRPQLVGKWSMVYEGNG